MANWTTLIAQIHSAVKENIEGEITGLVMQQTLDAMVNALGALSGFKGVATPTSTPATTDGTQFYLASQAGFYPNYGSKTISFPGIHVLEFNNGAWTLGTVYEYNEVSIMPSLNNTNNVSLSNNTLTFGASGFTLLVGNKKYLVSGNSDYTFSRASGTTRGFLYFNLDKIKGKSDGYSINWTSDNPFVVSNENLISGNCHLIASYYADELFINDTQLSYYLNHKEIVEGLNFPVQNKIYQQFGKLFCSAFPQVYVNVDTASNTITIPIGFSIVGLNGQNRYITTSEQTCTIIPVSLNGVAQISTLSYLLFNTSDLTFVNLLYSETQPENTLIVGVVRRSELSSIKSGDVYIWGLENYKIDGVIKGSANNIIDRNRDIETTMLSAVSRINTTQRYSFAHISDVHGSIESMTNLAYYVNNYPIQAVYNSGDQNENGGVLSDAMIASIDKLKKAYYPVIGNHDKGNGFPLSSNINNDTVYDRYIAPFVTQDGTQRIFPPITGATKKSYYKVDNAYNVRTIFLNEFDNDLIDGDNYAVSHKARCFSQAQIDWLITCLQPYHITNNPNGLPGGYHVIIMMHQPPIYIDTVPASGTVRSSFSFQGTVTYQGNKTQGFDGVSSNWILVDIIDAFLNKATLNKTYLFEPSLEGETYNLNRNAALTTTLNNDFKITVNTTFAYTTPKFVGYFFGHTHTDLVGFIKERTPYQAIVGIGSGSCVMARTTDDNVSRVLATKSQDLFNVCSVDTSNSRLFVVRIGADIDNNLSVRRSVILNYVTGTFG